jgi:ABC-type branched-subunit amino acid transport system substrate-binding protein
VASSKPNVGNAAKAAVDAINKDGGVKGSQLELVQCKNLFDQGPALDCARKGTSDDILAWVGQDDLFTDQTLPILEQANVPSIGLGTSGSPSDFTSPMSFPLSAGVSGAILSTPLMLKELGHKSITPVECEYPACKNNGKLMRDFAPPYNIDVTSPVEILNLGMPDYSPLAQRVKDMDADAVEFISSAGPALGLMKALADIGHKPALAANPQTIGENDAAENGELLENFLNPSAYPSPREYKKYPMMEQFVNDMAAFEGKSVENYLDAVVYDRSWMNDVQAWQGVYAAAAAIEAIPGDEVTRETLLKVLNDPSTSLNLMEFVTWTPGVAGPEGYERMPQMRTYFTTFKDGKAVDLDIPQNVDLVPTIKGEK